MSDTYIIGLLISSDYQEVLLPNNPNERITHRFDPKTKNPIAALSKKLDTHTGLSIKHMHKTGTIQTCDNDEFQIYHTTVCTSDVKHTNGLGWHSILDILKTPVIQTHYAPYGILQSALASILDHNKIDLREQPFDAVLLEKSLDDSAINIAEINKMVKMLTKDADLTQMVHMLEIEGEHSWSSGLITAEMAEMLDYDFDDLKNQIRQMMNDMNLLNTNNIYKLNVVKKIDHVRVAYPIRVWFATYLPY